MKPAVLTLPALVAGLSLVAGPGRADIHLSVHRPAAWDAGPGPRASCPAPDVASELDAAPHRAAVRLLRHPHIPQSYLIFGLKSGPGGMACTDRERQGHAHAVPAADHGAVSEPHQLNAPRFALPRFPALLAPKKLPQK